ncbi:hypothetical protein [Pedobacter frigoris]|uniref:hypothetical protein n=1 Tax=Pedobacter frigoris TaxID=2571272 RepID=UPI00292FFB33|nr:hypothetical protein [Pedobacter frigoris]
MQPLKIYFRITHTGNGKYLKTKNEVSNLIVDVIDRNPTKSATELRELVIQDFNSNPKAQKVLSTNDRFFIRTITDVEAIITFLPQERKPEEQFYTQWRYIQNSEPYRLVQYLDENKIVVYSERTKVIHTVKLDKDIVIIADENL